MCLRYYKDHDRGDYYIPSCLEDRFNYLQQKIQRNNPEYQESVAGHIIEFNSEFSKYKVVFQKGSIWEIKEECTDDDIFQVKIIKVTDSFITYKVIKPFWWFTITTGYKLKLNKWSFLRLFKEVKYE